MKKIEILKMRFFCYAKSFCNRRKGWIWEKGYWFFFPKAYDSIEKVYGKQSNHGW